MTERFTFGIPLIARAATMNWDAVEHLLGMTLRTVLAQTDAEFRVLLAAHDVPACWSELAGGDPRFAVLRADWLPERPSAANDDGGRKKWLIKSRMRAEGGGLLMFLDADDWVDPRLVATARAAIGPGLAGGVVARGWALDYLTGRAAAFPIAGEFEGMFHQLCGSSVIGRVDPAGEDLLRLDPHQALGQHGDWLDAAAARGLTLPLLDLCGVYMVGTPESHSEHHGPFAEWRRHLSAHVRRTGRPFGPLDMRFFGIEPGRFGRVASRAVGSG